MPTKRSSPRSRIIISSDIDISDTSNSAKLSCRQNISAGPSTVTAKSMPSTLTRPSMIGQVRGLLVMARLSCKLAMAASYNKFTPRARDRSRVGQGDSFMMVSFRRGFAAAIAAGALAVAAMASAPVSAQTALTVGKANQTSDAIIPVNVGDKLGIFKKHGLDLKIVDFGGGGKMVQALTAGAIDIGDGAGTEMAFVAKGAPMLAVCESTGPAPFLGIGVPWDSPIKTLQDLRGKTIGVSSPGSFSDWSGQQLARKFGWGPDGVKTVAIGGGPAPMRAALRAHLVDAAISTTALFLSFEETKEGRLIAPVSTFQGNVGSGALFASNSLIASNPDAIRAFLAGWIETVNYMRANKAETVKLTNSITNFGESVMAREYDLTIGMHTRDCRFEPEALAVLKQSFVEMKLVAGEPDMAKLYTEKFLPK